MSSDAAQTASNITSSERLFRLGTVSDLITFAAVVVLVWALYVVLEPTNRKVALLAAFWRIAACSIFAVIMLNDFATLRLLSGADYQRAFDARQVAGAGAIIHQSARGRISSRASVFLDWARPCSPICGSSRATSLEHWRR